MKVGSIVEDRDGKRYYVVADTPGPTTACAPEGDPHELVILNDDDLTELTDSFPRQWCLRFKYHNGPWATDDVDPAVLVARMDEKPTHIIVQESDGELSVHKWYDGD